MKSPRVEPSRVAALEVEIMLKSDVIRVSRLCALVPLASACAEAAPDSDLLDEPTVMGLSSLALESSAPASAHVFPREATPYGQSYEEWAAAWWQWLYAIPKSVNPQLGSPCDVDQSGQVFFLAANYGGATTRSCTLPAGKAIFFPLLNAFDYSCPEQAVGSEACAALSSEEDLHEFTEWLLDHDTTRSLEIDGVAVEGLDDYRVHTATFYTTAPEDGLEPLHSCIGPIRENVCGVPVGSPRNNVSDGYWVMLRPLPPGEHQIHFAAGVPEFQFSLDITYNITVAP
jgi:hypothetical protein